MSRLMAGTLLLTLFLTVLHGDDRPAAKSDRAEQFKAIRAQYAKEREEIAEGTKSGKIKANADGEFVEWTVMQERTAKLLRVMIDTDPTDEVGLNALLFHISELRDANTPPELYQLVLKHHVASEKIDPLVRVRSAPVDFLRSVIAKTPHATIRLWATYHLAENLYADDKPKDAEPLLENLIQDKAAKEIGGYQSGTIVDSAKRLLFEIQRLNVGQEVPEITGPDLDGKVMKLSETRGKVTLVVFWALWCGPCMEMMSHERELVDRYIRKPFVIVGVNGDIMADGENSVKGSDGKVIDNTPRIKAAIEKHKITWRSFRNGQYGVGTDWNVRTWPMVYLVDSRGIIRGKWRGDPEKELDAAIEKLVKMTEADKK